MFVCVCVCVCVCVSGERLVAYIAELFSLLGQTEQEVKQGMCVHVSCIDVGI